MNLTKILFISFLGLVLCRGPPPPKTKKDCKQWMTPGGGRKWKCHTKIIYPKKSWTLKTVREPDGTYRKFYNEQYSFDDVTNINTFEPAPPPPTPPPPPPTPTTRTTPKPIEETTDDDYIAEDNDSNDDDYSDIDSENSCGLRNLKTAGGGRIVGGRPAQRNEYPWMVGIELGDEDEFAIRGGGAIINKRWIVTAAHVFQGEPKISKYRGIIDTVTLNEAPVYVYFDRLIVHPDYKNISGNYYNDIALLHTTKDMALYPKRNGVNSICLPEASREFDGLVTVTGYGTTDEDATPTERLMTVDLTILNDEICRRQFKKEFKSRIMICAGKLSGGKDSCRGDSGGPMITFERKPERAYLIGVVSYGGYAMCARKNTGAVYTKVTQYVNWIRENSKET